MTVTPTYSGDLARVRIAATDAFTASYIVIQRSTNGVQWTTVRGAGALPASGGVSIDDYEFAPGVLNTYRAQSYSAVDALLGTQSATITPSIAQVWLKSVARPFLNMPVTVQDYASVRRPARAGYFSIPGRSFPVRVGDVAGSRAWTTTILTRTLAESRALDFLVASGDVLNVQVPPSFDIPGGYVGLGDVDLSRVSRPLRDNKRLFALPMTEVAAPAATVIGYSSTWAGIIADFGSWTAVMAAFPTWAAVQEYVADPSTVIVP